MSAGAMLEPEPRDLGTNNPRGHEWGEERQQATSFMQLSDLSKSALLDSNGYLVGVRIDDNDGPRRSTVPVARLASEGLVHAHQTHEIETDMITATNERETNFVHKGWSLPALSKVSPWTLSRIANRGQLNRPIASVTKRVTVQLLRVEIPLEDLLPVSEFEADIQTALQKPSHVERFQALYRVFEHWGDVIPLVYDLGTSITVTDLESDLEKCPVETSHFGLGQLTARRMARISTKGGDPGVLQQEVQKWLHNPVPVGRWAQVRIVSAAPITALLPKELQANLSQLSNSLIAYHPLTLDTFTSDGCSFDDYPFSLKTVKSITVCCGSHVDSLSVAYRDGTCSEKHGGAGGTTNNFSLNDGEYICEVVTWVDSKGVCALQFITNTGRISQSYGHGGESGGSLTIMRSTGGLLTAFAGQVKEGIVYRLQGLWRHDIEHEAGGERGYSRFYGGTAAQPFNDWPLLKHSSSAHVSSILVRCEKYVHGIQFTYADQIDGCVRKSEAPYRGGKGGEDKIFSLEPGEHIVTVTGRHTYYIISLRFVTNLGRSSPVFGGDYGGEFVCHAPRASDGRSMRLHYICGRSEEWVNGLLFVWAPF